MYNMHRFGQNRPVCNTRQFVTMGLINHHPEEMNLKPEYLGNEHFKFLNNFGLPSQFVADKEFVDINKSVNRKPSNHRMALNPERIIHSSPNTVMVNCTAAHHTHSGSNFCRAFEKSSIGSIPEEVTSSENINKTEVTNRTDMVAQKHEKVSECSKSFTKDHQEPGSCSNMKMPKKTKRNKVHGDKTNPKSSKKSKRQRSYHKQSKRESDRNVIGNSQSSRKRKNGKPWHKESLKMEIMDVSDIYFCSVSGLSLESPVITSVCSTSLPNIQSICIQNKVNNCLSSPVKISSESMVQNNKHSPSAYDRGEHHSDTPLGMGHSPKQNNFRCRLPSECESEDSFIVFEEDSKSIDLEDDQESTDCGMSSDEDSDDSDIGFCITTCSQSNRGLKASSPIKKVRFAAGKDLCEVHPMIQWSFAYQKARKGPWEQFAVDRMRFRNRVSDVEPILDVILQPAHRRKIYQERFLCDSDDNN